MPQRRDDWLPRIKIVEREWVVARTAVARLLEESSADPTILDAYSVEPPLRNHDVKLAASQLEGTYLIRLFAEFETGLRSYWKTVRPTKHPKAESLLNSIAGRRPVSQQALEQVHAVRRFRNHLVHERDEQVEVLALPDARSRLCRYFSFLPLKW